MFSLIQEVQTAHTPESLLEQLRGEPACVLLRTALFDSLQARYSFVTARPFLTFRSFGSQCELHAADQRSTQFGDPWRVLDGLMSCFELLEEADLPFPLGGCFGYWGYDLKNFIEPRLPRRAVRDLELPDCHVGFYASLVVFDHRLDKTWVVATGLDADGSRCDERATGQVEFWRQQLTQPPSQGGAGRDHRGPDPNAPRLRSAVGRALPAGGEGKATGPGSGFSVTNSDGPAVRSNLSRGEFVDRVLRAQAYIRAGDIYQVNLSHRLVAPEARSGWDLFQRLAEVSPAPFAAYLDCGEVEIASSSPESFLRLSGAHIQTRPIKGTRPRSADPTRDAQLTYELQTSAKEMAELVMITDLLRNDLGRVCEFGSVQVPELVRLERYPQVQHLVSTVEGRLRPGVTHFEALASCFPGGSITGAPKFRAMEIIDELEPVARGPYTGSIGYLGFNRESQLSIAIRTAICHPTGTFFHAGAGIVADSVADAEYEETLAKARGFLQALDSAGRRRLASEAARSEPG